jgi:hypothetical protein
MGKAGRKEGDSRVAAGGWGPEAAGRGMAEGWEKIGAEKGDGEAATGVGGAAVGFGAAQGCVGAAIAADDMSRWSNNADMPRLQRRLPPPPILPGNSRNSSHNLEFIHQ